jgi:hypothetical protein
MIITYAGATTETTGANSTRAAMTIGIRKTILTTTTPRIYSAASSGTTRPTCISLSSATVVSSTPG